MSYSPTIALLTRTEARDASHEMQETLFSHWPVTPPPIMTTDNFHEADVVLVTAESYVDLTSVLPILIELHATSIPTVMVCNDLGDLECILVELDITVVRAESDPTLITGILFGLLQRNEEVSQLRGQVGLVKTLHSSLQEELKVVQDELDTAASVQREFMSNDVRCIHGTSFSTLWRPFGVVSGDMFDITQLDDDHVAFFIADAIGHGISAAMLAMMLTRTLSANRFDPYSGAFTQPKDMLTQLNDALLQRSGTHARFATAAYGILNCKTNCLTFAGAGHPPALLSKTDGSNMLLESEGPLLGVFEEDVEFKQSKVVLSFGDTLLLYSDGFEHVFGHSKSADPLLPNHLQAMSQFCRDSQLSVLSDINTYLNNTLPFTADDDLTMICLQNAATPSSIQIAA